MLVRSLPERLVHDVKDIGAAHAGIVHDVIDYDATHADIVHDVKDTYCQIRNKAFTAVFSQLSNVYFLSS